MTTAVITRPVLKMGSKGPDVARVQTALQNAGFSPGGIDSDFGLKTDQAVRYFQIDNHLEVDGIVGKDTWALLQKYSTPTQMIQHRVEQGDTFYKLHEKYDVSVDAIKEANPGIDPTNIPVGKLINIPKTGGPGSTPPQVKKHKVQQGETFSKLAEIYDVDVNEIIKANPGIDPTNIPVGQEVNIPNTGQSGNATPQVKRHKVQQGETFSKLAEIYHVDVNEIIKANPGIDPTNIPVGQEVNIPNTGQSGNATDSTLKYRVHHYPKYNRYDTIGEIARKFNIKQAAIKDANPGINNTPIKGTMIVIPTASMPIPSKHVEITPIHHKVWNFFINKEFSATATAGIMGNLQQESDMIPTRYQNHGGPGRGIAQWETPGRWDDLKRSAHGREWDLHFQLEYILKDLQGHTNWVGATFLKAFGGYETLKKMSIYQAVIAFECSFELAGDPRFLDRFAFANSIYRSLASDVGRARA
ncbi:phage tail tip lysozyme [Bacillus cereus]|uniref:phage tail tip lysozyme n=1 Tax=Bacillus cereus TaxID=1396 RepID=UPI00356F6025